MQYKKKRKNKKDFPFSKKKNNEITKLEMILYSLAGIVGVLQTGLFFIADNNPTFLDNHPIMFKTGLGILALVLLSGLILSCVREYKISPYLFEETMKKFLLIFAIFISIVILLVITVYFIL